MGRSDCSQSMLSSVPRQKGTSVRAGWARAIILLRAAGGREAEDSVWVVSSEWDTVIISEVLAENIPQNPRYFNPTHLIVGDSL